MFLNERRPRVGDAPPPRRSCRRCGHIRFVGWTTVLLIALVLTTIATISIGVVTIPLRDICEVLLTRLSDSADQIDPKSAAIIWNIRTPPAPSSP